VAATGSSLGVLIWNEARHVELLEGQRLWQGWLLGDILQIALVVAPALRLFGRRVRTGLERQIPTSPRREFSYRDSVRWTLLVSTTLVGLAAVGLRMLFVSLGIPADANALAERVRAGVESGEFRVDGVERTLRVTCSLGTAGARTFPVDPDEIVALADVTCYGAKRAGRNRVLTSENPALA
jgi:hypothetical protein